MDMKAILSGKPAVKKPAVKTKKAKTKGNYVAPPITSGEPKTVRITKADNGFTVSHYGNDGETIKVAKTGGEAMKHAKGMLGC